jgi:Bacterial SH3 domain
MRWLAKTFTGLLLAATLLAVGGYFGVSYLMTQFTKLPPKPTFPNDNPDFVKKNLKKAEAKSDSKKSSDKTKETEKEAPKPKPLPPGAFEGRVTYAEGLVLRDNPARGATTLGGVDMNEKVTVLESSADGEWQRIRTNNDKEGWIRAGYVQKN